MSCFNETGIFYKSKCIDLLYRTPESGFTVYQVNLDLVSCPLFEPNWFSLFEHNLFSAEPKKRNKVFLASEKKKKNKQFCACIIPNYYTIQS